MTGTISQTEWDKVISKVQQGVQKIPATFQEIVNKINQVLAEVPSSLLPDNVRKVIADALKSAGEHIGKVVRWLADWLPNRGRPFQLWEYGTTWTREVGGKTSHWADALHFPNLKTHTEWDGTAALTFKGMTGVQQKALNAVKTATDQIDDILGNLATAIITLWVAVGASVAALLGVLVSAVPAVATVVGIPPAVGIVAATAVGVSTVVSAAASLFERVVQGVLPEVKNLNQTLESGNGFPEGRWPPLTATISDSSHRRNKGRNSAWELSRF